MKTLINTLSGAWLFIVSLMILFAAMPTDEFPDWHMGFLVSSVLTALIGVRIWRMR